MCVMCKCVTEKLLDIRSNTDFNLLTLSEKSVFLEK